MKYYSGKRYDYPKIFSEENWEIEPELLKWFKELNQEKFENKLPVPDFLIFSEENKKTNYLKVGGSIQFFRTISNPRLKVGIYISIEIYLYDKKESKKTLLHEMVHLYCKINNLKWHDGDVDFIYNCGKFGAPLCWNLKSSNETILSEIQEQKNSLEIHTEGIDLSDLI